MTFFDKAMIRFYFPDDAQWPAENKSWPNNVKPLFNISYAGNDIAHIYFEREHFCIYIHLKIIDSCVPDSFLGPAIIKNLRIECDQTVSSSNEEIEIRLISEDFRRFDEDLKQFGFLKSEKQNSYIASHSTGDAYKLGVLKCKLASLALQAPKVGRGYTMDASGESLNVLAALGKEYNEMAWGLTNWARHDEIAGDEALVVRDYVSGERALEIGAGSGRMTPFLAAAVKKLVATDYVSEVITKLQEATEALTNVSAVSDDITKSQFSSDSFDLVMFWENGLGSILNLGLRKLALVEMVRILKPGGKLILGLRRLDQSPIDHLMIAAQNPHVMGIYHTFCPEEIRKSIPQNVLEITLIEGDGRPAGGRQFFMIFEKESQ